MDGFTKKLFKEDTIIDYRSAPATKDDLSGVIHRLIDAGFVTQKSVAREYADVTGNYQGDAVYPAVTHHFDVNLEMKQGAADVKGKLSEIGASYPLSASITGNALPEGSYSLLFLVQYFNGMPNYDGPFIYKLNDMNGHETLTGPDPYDRNLTIYFAKKEPLNSAKISVPMFSYSFTPKAKVQVVNGSDQSSMGRIIVTGVDSLLLATDTVATAKFKWKFDYSEIGQVITLSKQPEKLGEVQFGKQPDGTWIITGINM
jgi:hypothetical protein